jgi:hypothetical protein
MDVPPRDPQHPAPEVAVETTAELSLDVRPVGAAESFGPLTVRRFLKVDDRALILYDRMPAASDQ